MSQKAIESGKRERRSLRTLVLRLKAKEEEIRAMKESHAKALGETREELQSRLDSLQKAVERLGVSPGAALRLTEENQMLRATLRLMEDAELLPKLRPGAVDGDVAIMEFYVPPFPDGWAPVKDSAPVFVNKLGSTFAKIKMKKVATKSGR